MIGRRKKILLEKWNFVIVGLLNQELSHLLITISFKAESDRHFFLVLILLQFFL